MNYLWKMRGYPQFCFSISIKLAKIYISPIIINRGKNTFELVGTALKLSYCIIVMHCKIALWAWGACSQQCLWTAKTRRGKKSGTTHHKKNRKVNTCTHGVAYLYRWPRLIKQRKPQLWTGYLPRFGHSSYWNHLKKMLFKPLNYLAMPF